MKGTSFTGVFITMGVKQTTSESSLSAPLSMVMTSDWEEEKGFFDEDAANEDDFGGGDDGAGRDCLGFGKVVSDGTQCLSTYELGRSTFAAS